MLPTLNADYDYELQLAKVARDGGDLAPLHREALGIRTFALENTETGETTDPDTLEGLGQTNQDIAEDIARDRAEQIEKQYGPAAAKKFYSTATATRSVVPIDEYLHKFNAEKPAETHTIYRRKMAITNLKNWKPEVSINGYTRSLMRDYVEKQLMPGRRAGTVNSDLGVLGQYWHWLMDKGYMMEGPVYWSKFRLQKQRKSIEDKERAFNDQEMKRLFCGNLQMRPDLLEHSTTAALTGARQNEVGELRVGDLNFVAKTIHLPGEKTAAADRTIPLHPDLFPMLKERCKGKTERDYVFHELPIRKSSDLKSRSSPISKAFTRFRRSVGVGFGKDRTDRSPVNFHSFRRWFSKELLEHEAPADLVDFICGWTSGSMRETYAWTADRKRQARQFIEKVKLPKR
ncbi:tyrosine-type recombinase/integrase [Aestuariivirga litoralis]|uniref:tyrosine-type recombinase/integrase n=1 Tax=Aestuariivirga litoralis TaxID=2650924 RepID=UPI0018C79B89|nr:site-specific integrase [Aestuariivirga litoralis]